MIRGLLHFLPNDGAPLMLKAEPDTRVLLFNGVLALLTGVLFGLAPALQALRVDLWNTLEGRGGHGERRRQRRAAAQGDW